MSKNKKNNRTKTRIEDLKLVTKRRVIISDLAKLLGDSKMMFVDSPEYCPSHHRTEEGNYIGLSFVNGKVKIQKIIRYDHKFKETRAAEVLS